MNLLSQNSALSAGHELWVLPHYETSSWTPKIDWMMNFQILKNLRHVQKTPDAEIYRILKDNEIQTQLVEIDTDNLLIPSQLFFANTWILYSPVGLRIGDSEYTGFEKDSGWINKIHKTWSNLNSPSMRIFLAKTWKPAQVQAAWAKLEDKEIALVADVAGAGGNS